MPSFARSRTTTELHSPILGPARRDLIKKHQLRVHGDRSGLWPPVAADHLTADLGKNELALSCIPTLCKAIVSAWNVPDPYPCPGFEREPSITLPNGGHMRKQIEMLERHAVMALCRADLAFFRQQHAVPVFSWCANAAHRLIDTTPSSYLFRSRLTQRSSGSCQESAGADQVLTTIALMHGRSNAFQQLPSRQTVLCRLVISRPAADIKGTLSGDWRTFALPTKSPIFSIVKLIRKNIKRGEKIEFRLR